MGRVGVQARLVSHKGMIRKGTMSLREWWSSAVLSLSKGRASALLARIETQSATGEELSALS